MRSNVVHIEIPADNLERAKKFYSQLFDWSIQTPPGYDDYPMVPPETGSSGPGLALMPRPQGVGGIIDYFSVDSVDDAVARIKQLGGTIVAPRTPVPGMGWFAQFLDSEGNLVGLWQSDESVQ